MHTPRINSNPSLTRHLVQSGVFRKNPFCLVDVGASGGIDGYWEVFGDNLRAFGFDGLVNEIKRLNAGVGKKDYHYYPFLVGKKAYQSPATVPDMQPFE